MTPKTSYCTMHNTLPKGGEPCWQCANPFILQAYVEGKRDGMREVINRVLDPHLRKSAKEEAAQ